MKITKKQSGCGFRYKIWAKLVPILRKNHRKWHYQLAIFSNFAWETHSKGRRKKWWLEISDWKFETNKAQNITFEENWASWVKMAISDFQGF